MFEILNVNSILFSPLGYPMSYVEFFGTVFYALSIWLAVKKNILTWPTSLAGVALFAVLFFQIQLYSDLLEQIYYLVVSVWGWWVWASKKNDGEDKSKEIKISSNSLIQNAYLLGIIVVGTVSLTVAIQNLPTILPNIFSVPASYPVLDAFTTVMSFVATYLLVKKKIENWYLWIFVDVTAVWLYFQKEVIFLSILYAGFLVLAIKGLTDWKRLLNSYEKN